MSYTGIGFSFMLDIWVFKTSFTHWEVYGVFICLFFSCVTALYKHFCAPKPIVIPEEPISPITPLTGKAVSGGLDKSIEEKLIR